MSPKVLQYVMGRSEIGVTLNTYTHLGFEGGSRGDEPAIRQNMCSVRSSVLHHSLHRIGMRKPVRI